MYASVAGCYIEVFNESGSKVHSIGSRGSGDLQFDTPCGIAVRGDIIYVADTNNHCIQKLTLSGNFVSKFGTEKGSNNYLSLPRGVCLDHDGRVFVADSGNSRVNVFSGDGTFLYRIGESSNTLDFPWDLAFDPSGNLHVADSGLKCVKVFSPRGDYVIAEYGRGQLNAARYIAINEEGYSFVSDGTLSIFDSQHKLVYRTADMDSMGVALDRDGHIYASSNYKLEILKF